jgi:hypothetical protein
MNYNLIESFPFPVINQIKKKFRVKYQSITILQISGQHSKRGDNFLLQHETREMSEMENVVIQSYRLTCGDNKPISIQTRSPFTKLSSTVILFLFSGKTKQII